MPKFHKTKEELDSELIERVQALRSAAQSYDDGNSWAAKDLSNHLYILAHDGTGRTKSLLGLVGKKKGLRFLSSAVQAPEINGFQTVMTSAPQLVSMRFYPDGARYAPILDGGPRRKYYQWLPFSRWYDQEVFNKNSSLSLSRRNMIFTMRSQDGGAHVDAAITSEDYRTFDKEGDPAIRPIRSQGKDVSGETITGGVRATIRQIAWEMDQTLIEAGL